MLIHRLGFNRRFFIIYIAFSFSFFFFLANAVDLLIFFLFFLKHKSSLSFFLSFFLFFLLILYLKLYNAAVPDVHTRTS